MKHNYKTNYVGTTRCLSRNPGTLVEGISEALFRIISGYFIYDAKSVKLNKKATAISSKVIKATLRKLVRFFSFFTSGTQNIWCASILCIAELESIYS